MTPADRPQPSARVRRPLHVVIAGAGVAGLETLLALRALAEDRVEIDVLTPESCFSYRPLHVLEPFGTAPLRFDLDPLIEEQGARRLPGVLVGVDAGSNVARTGAGEEIAYDVLVVTCGGRYAEGVLGALTVPGLGDLEDFARILDDAANGRARRIAFALPGGAGWPLPLYELALLTSSELARRDGEPAEIVVVTPETEPLALFGSPASAEVRRLLDERVIELVTATYPVSVESDGLRVRPGGLIAADRVVALPKIEGPRIAGLHQDTDGFLLVDPEGLAVGVDDVYGAGDAVAFPVKQGGIAAQQADAVAAAIATLAGAAVTPIPFQPVLRGLLLTGDVPRFLRSDLVGGHGLSATTSHDALWWPPSKIAGRYLGPYLAGREGIAAGPERKIPAPVGTDG